MMTSSNGFRGASGDFPRAATSVVTAAPNVTASDHGERQGTAVPPSAAATAGAVVGSVLVVGGALVFLTAATLAITMGGRHRNDGKRRSAHGKAPEPRGGRNGTSLSRTVEPTDAVIPWLDGSDPYWAAGLSSQPRSQSRSRSRSRSRDDFPGWPVNQPRPPQDIYQAPPAGDRTAARGELPTAQHLAPWERAEARQEPVLPPRTRPGSGSQPAAQNWGANPASSSSGPMRQYNPPSGPMPGYDAPYGPLRQNNHPSGPMRQYNQPPRPTHPYDAPSGPLPQYNQPSGPTRQYNQPSGPLHQYNQPSGPTRQYNQPSEPTRPYGPPSGQPVQYQYGPPPGQAVQQYAAREGSVEQLDRLGRESGKLWTVDSVRLANQILSTANQQAAEVRQEAEEWAAAAKRETEELLRWAAEEAAAKVAAAEQEAAEIRAAVMKLSAELTEVATHVTTNLPKPTTRQAARSAKAVATKPGVSPRHAPDTRTDGKPKNRQLSAAHKVVAAFVALSCSVLGLRHSPRLVLAERNGQRSFGG